MACLDHQSLPLGGIITLGHYYGTPRTNAGEHSSGGSHSYLSCLPGVPIRCRKPFGPNTLKRFIQHTWRGGNWGAWVLTTPRYPRGDSCALPGLNVRVMHSQWPAGIPPLPPSEFLRSWKLARGFYSQQDLPPKLRCEASCRGLRGTGVAIGLCRKRSPRGTRQHPVVFMPSTRMGLCGW
jgi:hypothetical protein